MGGTRASGLKTAITNKARYGQDYYRKMGALGGSMGHTGGFYQNRELASIAGAKGGSISRKKGQSAHSEYCICRVCEATRIVRRNPEVVRYVGKSFEGPA